MKFPALAVLKLNFFFKNKHNITNSTKSRVYSVGYNVHISTWRMNYPLSFHNSENITSGNRGSQKQKHNFPHLGNGWHKNTNNLQECWGIPCFQKWQQCWKGVFQFVCTNICRQSFCNSQLHIEIPQLSSLKKEAFLSPKRVWFEGL